MAGQLVLGKGNAPATPPTGYSSLYVKNDGVPYVKNDAGVEASFGGTVTGLSGDVSGSGSGTIATTLGTVNSNVGTYGNSSNVAQVTVDGKGRITAVSNVSIPASMVYPGSGVPVSTGSAWSTSLAYTNVNTASTLVLRDVNGNANFVNVIATNISTVTSGQTINMTAASAQGQIVTGSSTITFNLPDATTCYLGQQYTFDNDSSGLMTVNLKDGVTLVSALPAGSYAVVICSSNGTTNGVWHAYYLIPDSTNKWGTAGLNTGSQITSTVSTGTAPLVIASTTPVANLSIGGNAGTATTAAGLSATLVPASGGTGVANNNASTLTISGNYASTFTVSGAYTYTLPGATTTLAGLGVVQSFSKAQIGTPVALSVSSNLVAVDLSLANNFTLTLQATTAQTLSNPSNAVAGQSGSIYITQNGTPSTLAYGTNWYEETTGVAPTVSTTASAQNSLHYEVFDSTHIYYVLNKHGVA